MSKILATIAICALFLPFAQAHGALELNQFDTYAISDFEGQEDSFPWEGFEIWDIYAGDGYHMESKSHGVYFKGNFAGDGTLRPTGGSVWSLLFTFDVASNSYERTISHDGTTVTTDFEVLEHQISDGNVFQIHAWVPIQNWTGSEITNLVVLSSVDGSPRDVAPGGIFDPVLGVEVPVEVPPTPMFPEMGEGRLVESIPLTGSAKFLDVAMTPSGDSFTFSVNNTLATQGQHFLVSLGNESAWDVGGKPNVQTLDGGAGITFTLDLQFQGNATISPLQIDLMSDVGALQSWFAYVDGGTVKMTPNAAEATQYVQLVEEEAPAAGLMFVLIGLAAIVIARRR